MNSKGFALRVLGVEALALALLGGLGYAYLKSNEKPEPPPAAGPTKPVPPPPAPGQATVSKIVEDYGKSGKGVADLAATMTSRKNIDLVMFVIDTSASMTDDRKELRDSIDKILKRYKGKLVQIVDFGNTAQVTGEPTRDLAELQRRLDASQDLGGTENSFQALKFAAEQCRSKFKRPLVVLMTDAAPNDGFLFSGSNVTLQQAADALNAANAELHVWAAFDDGEYRSGGTASASMVYPELVKLIKAGGERAIVTRNGFDPASLFH
ncbi:MAG TPA: vWA domain-containing protein [Blastocatellia bacterium]|nr:vWA domain-containing protein [Blastocatellia bacterium]